MDNNTTIGMDLGNRKRSQEHTLPLQRSDKRRRFESAGLSAACGAQRGGRPGRLSHRHRGRHDAHGPGGFARRREATPRDEQTLDFQRHEAAVGDAIPVAVAHRHVFVALRAEAPVDIDGVRGEEDGIVRNASLKAVGRREPVFAENVAGFADADG